jgi:hypothetical protein
MRDENPCAAYRRGDRCGAIAAGKDIMKKPGFLSVLFGLIGVGLLVGAAVLVMKTRSFIAAAKHAPGTVTELLEKRDRDDGSISYTPVVEFNADNGASIRFTSSFSSKPAAYDVGERVEVLYAPNNPNDARINGFGSLWLAPLILGGIGVAFAGIGFGILIAFRANQKKRAWLMAYGTEIQAEFQSVERVSTHKKRGRRPWRIVAQWQNPETGQLHIFNSENLWFDPTAHVKTKQVKVLLDPKDSKRYHLDVSFLPQLAPGS